MCKDIRPEISGPQQIKHNPSCLIQYGFFVGVQRLQIGVQHRVNMFDVQVTPKRPQRRVVSGTPYVQLPTKRSVPVDFTDVVPPPHLSVYVPRNQDELPLCVKKTSQSRRFRSVSLVQIEVSPVSPCWGRTRVFRLCQPRNPLVGIITEY